METPDPPVDDDTSRADTPPVEEDASGEEYQLEDEEYDPSEQEVAEYCEWLGMDLTQERSLTWIAREALKAPLPEYWKICYTDEREVYYFNMRTGESIWDHPMDAFYKALFKQERAKLESKLLRMRIFAGSMPIVPLQSLFSDLSGEEGGPEIPERLCDPIDFMLLVDPVVLPTSGRTVSKHTIVNNKWRDPFTREYVENRRLISNVDKRNEVGSWLAKAVKEYFVATAFPSEWKQWGRSQGTPYMVGDGHKEMPSEVPNVAALWPAIERVLPYILDKEDEVCLDAQRWVLYFLVTGYALPGKVRGRGGLRHVADVRVLRTAAQVTAANELHEIVAALPDAGVLLKPLLTMSTSASLEALCLVLSHHPPLRAHPCFFGFDAPVLHVLQMADADLTTMCSSLTAHSFPPKTTNTDYLVKLQWCYLLFDSPGEMHVLSRIPWDLSFAAIATAYHSLPQSSQLSYLTIKMLRCLPGWPANIKSSDHEAIQWVVALAIASTDAAQQTLLLYDLLVSTPDAAVPLCRRHGEALVRQLLEGDNEQGADTPDATPTVTPTHPGHSAQLGALLVFHDVCRLDDFASAPSLQIRVADAITPRLTRVQWRPRHFEATVKTMIAIITARPELAWATFQSSRAEFLLKELAKKRKNNETLRVRLEQIEATAKRLQQTAAINHWAVLSAKLLKGSSPGISLTGKQPALRRTVLTTHRVENLVLLLETLLAARVKKHTRGGQPAAAAAAAAAGGGGGGSIGLGASIESKKRDEKERALAGSYHSIPPATEAPLSLPPI